MRIGLYGMPCAGKTHLLKQVDFMPVFEGSTMLKQLSPEFHSLPAGSKAQVRSQLARTLMSEDSLIMDGHYAFGSEIVFTEEDGVLYDLFLYLYVSPDVLKQRMAASAKNCKYLTCDLESWQQDEVTALRAYCHDHNKDFYVIDHPSQGYYQDCSDPLAFIRAIQAGFSCRSFAKKCSALILEQSAHSLVTLVDGDKTLIVEDSSEVFLNYRTCLYDGNFYTGFQSWRQGREFLAYELPNLNEFAVTPNPKVFQLLTGGAWILTSGHQQIWQHISRRYNLPYFAGEQMSAETKYFITKLLQEAGKTVIAFGDGMNDYFMLRQADRGYLITKAGGTVSRSLNHKSLEGLILV